MFFPPFKRKPRIRLVRQATYFECGIACLVMVARAFGANVSLSAVRKAFPPSARGMTLKGIVRVADEIGLKAIPVSINLEGLSELQRPAIIHWGFSHYVVLAGFDGETLDIYDPAHGRRALSLAEAAPFITGVAIEFDAESSHCALEATVQPLRLLDLLPERKPFAAPLALAAAASLCLELLLVLLPWIVSRAVAPGVGREASLLGLALLGLLVLAALAVTRTVRGALVIRLSGATQKEIMATAFARLLAKPASFFEQRYATYVVSRFEGTDRLRTVLSEDYLNAFIDLALLIVLAGAMASLNPTIALIAGALAVGVGAIRLFFGLLSKSRLDEVVHARALERLHLMETVRSIRALQQYGRTDYRSASYGRRLDNSIMHQANHGWYRVTSDAVATFLSDAAWIGMVLYLVSLGPSAHGGAAGLLALILYSRMLMDRSSLLSGKLAELASVGVQLEHLSDLVETEPAPNGTEAPEIRGALRVTDLSFGYDNENLILERFSMTVAPGEFVAIEGPSGSGKTTLLKLLAGLLPKGGGRVQWSGVDVEAIDPRHLQRSVAFVFQDDELIEGDILRNITLFETEPDLARVWVACRAARIDGDILAMPMRLQTMVGERGSALSGGQRQRLLIARALYHRPQVLLLDEATSQLDIANERAIHAELKRSSMTVIMVSHRPEAVAAAERVFRVGIALPPQMVEVHA